MSDVSDRLKILIDSSTPIIMMERVKELRAVRLVREASSPLNLAVLEWSIASGLSRCGGDTHVASVIFAIQLQKRKKHPADFDLERIASAAVGFSGAEIDAAVESALYSSLQRATRSDHRDSAPRSVSDGAFYHQGGGHSVTKSMGKATSSSSSAAETRGETA